MPKSPLGSSDSPSQSDERNREHIERIERIASNQRMILLVLLAYLVAGWLASAAARPGEDTSALRLAVGVVALGAVIAGLVYAVRMADALHGPGNGALVAILLLVPLVNLITLLVLNGRATRELKNAGLKVGLLGVSSGQLASWRLARSPASHGPR